ncbi:MAG: ABC transporter permease, partial [Chlamydiales bacterium]|nr:ABC transporter permease [Chlamydiales bacterium]
SSPHFLTQACYVASFPDRSPYVRNLLLPVRAADINHLYFMSGISSEGSLEDEPERVYRSSATTTQTKLKTLLEHATVTRLKTVGPYWKIPSELFPSQGTFQARAQIKNGVVSRLFLDSKKGGVDLIEGTLLFENKTPFFLPFQGTERLPLHGTTPLFVEEPLTLQGTSIPSSLHSEKIRFAVQTQLQGTPLQGEIPFEGLEITEAAIQNTFKTQELATAPWISYISQEEKSHLPITPEKQVGVLLAKNFQDLGVLIGDKGYLSYGSATASAIQEQRLAIYVAGFYDPGVLPIGAKCILAPSEIAHIIHSGSNSFHLDPTQASGIQVWFKSLTAAADYKEKILFRLKEAGIEPYWKVSTFHEYDFAKDLFQQFQSDQHLFTLVGIIILIVACCNIISLLVLLVNDKKKEIGILQSMGASNKSIAIIFGTCGIFMGLLGTLIGTCAAIATLHHIDGIVHFLSLLQGHNPFNAAFFGASLPDTLSHKAFLFIAIATPLLSLCAGLIPAIKACRLKPSAILRTE